MIAVDTNLLVYAHRPEGVHYAKASERLRELAEGSDTWAIPWPCVHEFYGIATNAKIFKPPTPPANAIAQLDAWFESPTLRVIGESSLHWATLKASLLAGEITGAMAHDARIAAICVQHGVREFWTADRDFSRFPNLRTRNPLN